MGAGEFDVGKAFLLLIVSFCVFSFYPYLPAHVFVLNADRGMREMPSVFLEEVERIEIKKKKSVVEMKP